jgi:hypothetical protein
MCKFGVKSYELQIAHYKTRNFAQTIMCIFLLQNVQTTKLDSSKPKLKCKLPCTFERRVITQKPLCVISSLKYVKANGLRIFKL